MGAAWHGAPSYLRLGAGELAARARQALALLGEERCRVCPRLCKVDRLADHKGVVRDRPPSPGRSRASG